MVWETWVQSQVASYQRLKKWYLILSSLTLSNIRYVSRIKWKNPGKRIAPYPTPRGSSYGKRSLLVALDYGRQLNLYIYIYIYIYIALDEQDVTPCQFLIRSLTGLNSEISFSWTGYHTRVKESCLPYYLPIAEGRLVGFILFLMVFVLREMQIASSRFWTRNTVSIFNDDNHCTTASLSLSLSLYIYIYIYIYIYSCEIQYRVLGQFVYLDTVINSMIQWRILLYGQLELLDSLVSCKIH